MLKNEAYEGEQRFIETASITKTENKHTLRKHSPRYFILLQQDGDRYLNEKPVSKFHYYQRETTSGVRLLHKCGSQFHECCLEIFCYQEADLKKILPKTVRKFHQENG